MKLKNTLLCVHDMEKSKAFYKQVLGLHVTADFGANVTLTGGLCLQTLDSWKGFIEKKDKDIHFAHNTGEIYFEVKDLDHFMEKLDAFDDIELVHPVKVHDWGQRVVRFYDPDGHIIEVGEDLRCVMKRFLKNGMSVEKTAKRMGLPVALVKRMAK